MLLHLEYWYPRWITKECWTLPKKSDWDIPTWTKNKIEKKISLQKPELPRKMAWTQNGRRKKLCGKLHYVRRGISGILEEPKILDYTIIIEQDKLVEQDKECTYNSKERMRHNWTSVQRRELSESILLLWSVLLDTTERKKLKIAALEPHSYLNTDRLRFVTA